jgi:DNA-binding transcriptional LysR family regulator
VNSHRRTPQFDLDQPLADLLIRAAAVMYQPEVVAVLSARQIEIVKAIAGHRSFALAAKSMEVSLPSLKRSLDAIERSLGVPIIDRRGVTPTMFGEIVLRHGARVLMRFSELAREIDLARGLGMGELKVAAGPYPADISVVRSLGVLTARHPMLAAELRSANWSDIEAQVRENHIDLGVADITAAARDPELETQAIRIAQLNFFCAADHPLARKKDVTLKDLFEFPWAGPSLPGRALAGLPPGDTPAVAFCKSSGRFEPRVLVETFSAAKDIVLAGQALSAAVEGQIDREIREGLLVMLPVNTPWLKINYGFITKRGRTLSPAALSFMEILHTIERDITA